MSNTFLRLFRRALLVLSTTALVGLLVLVIAAHLGPVTGHETYVIRGSSMQPAIALGSLIIDERVPVSAIRPGDVVTVRLHDAVVVTHRVVRVVDLPEGPQLELKGDGNQSPDAALVPSADVVGRVALIVPVAGYFLAMISLPAGLVSALSFLVGMFIAIALLDQLAADRRRDRPAPGPVVGAGARA